MMETGKHPAPQPPPPQPPITSCLSSLALQMSPDGGGGGHGRKWDRITKLCKRRGADRISLILWAACLATALEVM